MSQEYSIPKTFVASWNMRSTTYINKHSKKYRVVIEWKHWCPSGCGKQCVFDQSMRKYVCRRCGKSFTKDEMAVIQKMARPNVRPVKSARKKHNT